MKEYTILDEGHTIGCLLRNHLLSSSRFAACIVRHPQETNLIIKLDDEASKDNILHAILDVDSELQKMINSIKKSEFYDDSFSE